MNMNELMNGIDLERIKTDKYYLMYKMMINSLNTADAFVGLKQSLFLLKAFLNADNIILHRESKKEGYKNNLGFRDVGYYFKLFINSDDLDYDYTLIVDSINTANEINEEFWKDVHDSMLVILKRAESYERNTRAINEDVLTGLNNRNSYEKRIKKLDSEKDELVFALFDLFRLKYINDNFSHSVGDRYIIEASKILEKYWPSAPADKNNNYYSKVEIKNCVYRVGGDEFALLATDEDIIDISEKAQMAADDVAAIDLGLDRDVVIGLNYGVAKYDGSVPFRDVHKKADEEMYINKQKMYVETGIDRRRR